MPTDHRAELQNIRTFPSLVRYLRDEMDWPIEQDSFEEMDENLFYDFTPDELGIDSGTAAKIESIRRLRPLTASQTWGIFFVKFEPKRLPVVALRRILSQVVIKKRATANRADRVAWQAEDLLFISNYGEGNERRISFAHFCQDPEKKDLPTLKVLGWDNLDTPLHLDDVAEKLTEYLAWPSDDGDLEGWRQRWRAAFTLRHREVITTSKELSIRLAELARTIRDRIRTAMAIETERGPLTRLMKAFQEALIHDLQSDGFADMYAQTIAYGLLSARIANPKADTADHLPAQIPVTNPFLKELMETFLLVGGRRGKAGGSGIDFDELGVSEVVELLDDANMEAVIRDFGDRNPQEDPVIHFYEHFLAAYDKKQKVSRGVFYTPRPVVSYIVRSVDELLRTEFGLEDGLADTTTWGEMLNRVDAASSRVHYFDPEEPVTNLSGNLPHWRQVGVTYFVTFRLDDSLPEKKLNLWIAERNAWLKAHPEPHTPELRRRFYDLFPARLQHWLDQGHGSCVLERSEIKEIVENALRHFDGQRYNLDEFVVMPNHVHVLVTPMAEHSLSQILHSWKSFTAGEINRRLGSRGTLWQKESFDHIVRSAAGLKRIREYIRGNPGRSDDGGGGGGGGGGGDKAHRGHRQDSAITRQDAASTFKIPEGISSEQAFVQILDPATGTGTFLVEVIDVIHRTLVEKWQRLPAACWKMLREETRQDAASTFESFWNEYVPKQLLPRLHGYELLMAPYAIAHLKIGLKLYETGYHFGSDERARIYLTNALEPAHDFSGRFEFAIPAIAHEARAVNTIKRQIRFTVVIGNPPYSNFGQLNRIPFILDLLGDYKRRLSERKLNLDDDFIKFIRFNQYLLQSTGVGSVGLITNNTYLDGITHRRMRESLRETFNQILICDLHGSLMKADISPDGSVDENVFDIKQGVAVSLLTRNANPSAHGISYSELWGSRVSKYSVLINTSINRTRWEALLSGAPNFFFVPKSFGASEEYRSFPSISEVFREYVSVIQTGRDSFVSSDSQDEFDARIETLKDESLSDATIAGLFELPDFAGFDLRGCRRALRDKARSKECLKQWLYRPFDVRPILFDETVIKRTRGAVMQSLTKPNLALISVRQLARDGFAHVFVTKHMGDGNTISLNTREYNYYFPLRVYRDAAQGTLAPGPTLNLSERFGRRVSEKIGTNLADQKRSGSITPEDILHFGYAVFHSPGYRIRYTEFLKIDFPRLPLPANLELFCDLANTGSELVALHLMESPKLSSFDTIYNGPKNPEVGRVAWAGDAVWLDAKAIKKGHPSSAGTIGFEGVPQQVWNFHIGGYQVCEKWLKDRKGRTLSNDDIIHYQKIVVAINETIRLMAEIDKVIEAHGGWPGAFDTSGKASAAVQKQGNDQSAKLVAFPAKPEPEKHYDTEPEAVEVAAELPQPAYRSIDETEREELMADIRDLFESPEAQNGLDRDEALRRLNDALGFRRLGPHIREVLENDLLAAARRGIVETRNSRLFLVTRSIDNYDRDFLKNQFLASLGQVWRAREEAAVRFARWLGFRRTGANIQAMVKSLINGLLREGRLEAEDSRIRHCK